MRICQRGDPHQSTIHRLFRKLSAEELEAVFRRLFLHILHKEEEQRRASAVAVDGKAQRGRLKFEEEHGYPVHAVSLVDHQTGIVLTQGHIEKADIAPTSNLTGATKQEEQEAKKQQSELAVASRLIGQIDWKGKVLTGDALYCQRCLCYALRHAGGDYLFLVKGNQPNLFEDIRLLFAPPAPAKRAGACGHPQYSGLLRTQRLR